MGRRLDAGLRFLLLVAAREVFPGERLVVEHARSHGYFACLEGRTLDAAGVARIRGRMRTWVERNEPFRSREMSGREAAETLAADGQEDKAPIVRRLPTVTLYYLGQTPCYLHGGVPATTGELRDVYKRQTLRRAPAAGSAAGGNRVFPGGPPPAQRCRGR